MTDPRVVEPQRVPPPCDDGDACGHRYWCWKRITGLVLLVLLVSGLGSGLWWWVR